MQRQHTRLYLIRHGQVEGHEKPAYNGHTDVALTDLGKAQAKAAADELKSADLAAVYASDLKRAAYGGRQVARMHGLELLLEPGFREICFGEWEGLTFEEIERRFPGEMTRRFDNMADHQIPGAETIRGFWGRVNQALAGLLERHRGQDVALVAHSGVNRAILIQAFEGGPDLIWRMDQDYGCLNIVDYFGDGRTLVRLANYPNAADGSTPNRDVNWAVGVQRPSGA